MSTEAPEMMPTVTLTDAELIRKARETADIAFKERKLGMYLAPYAGACLRLLCDRLERKLAEPAHEH